MPSHLKDICLRSGIAECLSGQENRRVHAGAADGMIKRYVSVRSFVFKTVSRYNGDRKDKGVKAMKKQWIILMAAMAILSAGCQAETNVSVEQLRETKQEAERTVSFSGSKPEPTGSEQKASEEKEQSEASVTEEPSIAETSAAEQETSESSPTPTESKDTVTIPEKQDDAETKPGEAPQAKPVPEPAKPAETVSEDRPEGTAMPEPTKEPAPTPPRAPEPKSIYDYEFDVEAIREELICVGTEMGLIHTGDMTPAEASWGNPVTATREFQGAGLERSLKDYVRSMPEMITAYGGEPIQFFTIYAENIGSGSYRFYFLY